MGGVTSIRRRRPRSSTNERSLTKAALQCEGSAVNNKLHRDDGQILGHASAEGFISPGSQGLSVVCFQGTTEARRSPKRTSGVNVNVCMDGLW